MIKFNFKDNKLIIDPHTLTISVFNRIWELDRSKDKAMATKMLTHIFHVADITADNAMMDSPIAEIPRISKKNLFGKADYKFTEEQEQLIDEGIAWYTELNKNSLFRLLRNVDRKIDQINEYLEASVYDPKNPDKDSKIFTSLKNLLKDRDEIEKSIVKERKISKVKANAEPSLLEKGLIGYKRKTKTVE